MGKVEKKSALMQTKAIEGRKVTGIATVFGNIDAYRDRAHPGSFAKTLQENFQRMKFLWNHNTNEPPTAKLVSAREIGRDELPAEVLALAPDATGGVEVVREYLKTPRADEILEGLREGAINEMSYMFEVIKADYSEDSDGRIRELRELKVYEFSDVVFGANEATLASKREALLASAEDTLMTVKSELKSGQRNSADDQERINRIYQLAIELGADTSKSADESVADEDAKSRAEVEAKADTLTLTLLDARLAELGFL